MNNTVSLIVLNYNDYLTTSSFLDRIKNYNSINSIIVVDNHSTDNSYELLKKYETNRICVIKTPFNGGYGYGNNYGIKYAVNNFAPEFIIISNPDVIFEEQLVTKMVTEISKKDEYSCIAPFMCDINGAKVKGTAWKVPTPLQYTLASCVTINKLLKLNKYSDLESENIGNIKEVECLAGSFFMVKAKDMIDFGLYDEAIFLYCEETYLGIKMKENQKKMLLMTEEHFIHAHGVSINKAYKSALEKQWLVWNSKKIIMKKYMGCSDIILFFVHLFFCVCTIEQWFLCRFKK